MPWKVNADGSVVSENGMPVFVHPDGKEVPFDADKAMAKIGELNNESATRRIRLDEVERKLKLFDGLDPEKARAAVETVANYDAKKLVDAEKVAELVKERLAAASGEWEKERSALKAAVDTSGRRLWSAIVSKAIATSPVLKDIVLPADAIERLYGDNIKLSEDGTTPVVCADTEGKHPIYSKERPGEVASLDEGLRALLERRPDYDAIKRVPVVGGVPTGDPKAKAGGKTILRSEYEKKSPTEQVALVKGGAAIVDS